DGRGIQALIDEETAQCLPDGSKGLPRQRVADASQLLLVLGGDGTMLAAARLAAPRRIPILPINMGSLGFLTSFTLEELHPALDDTLEGRFSLSERVMISAELERSGKVIDRQRGIPLQPTDMVRVSRAKEPLMLIYPPKKSYFEILRSKLKWGEA